MNGSQHPATVERLEFVLKHHSNKSPEVPVTVNNVYYTLYTSYGIECEYINWNVTLHNLSHICNIIILMDLLPLLQCTLYTVMRVPGSTQL